MNVQRQTPTARPGSRFDSQAGQFSGPLLGHFFGRGQLGRVATRTRGSSENLRNALVPLVFLQLVATEDDWRLLLVAPGFQTHNRLVPGSNPGGPTIAFDVKLRVRGDGLPIERRSSEWITGCRRSFALPARG